MTWHPACPLVQRYALLSHCPGADLLAVADAGIAADPAAQAMLALPGASVTSDLQTRVTEGVLRIKSVLWTVQLPQRQTPGLRARSLSVLPDRAVWFDLEDDPALAMADLLQAEGTTVLRYVPGRRATLRLRDGDAWVIRKIKKNQRVTEAISRHRAVEQAVTEAPFHLPRLAGSNGTYALTFCSGRPMTDGPVTPDQMLALGAAVAHLHSCDARDLPPVEVADAPLPWLRAALPGLAAHWDRLEERMEEVPGQSALCHGDLSPAQVLLAEDQLTLLDFDRAGAGCAAQDLATLLVALAEHEADCNFDAEASVIAGYSEVLPLPQGLSSARARAELEALRHVIRKGTAPTRRVMGGVGRAEGAWL